MKVKAYLYDADGTDREVALDDIAVDKLTKEELLWIDVSERDPSLLSRISTILQLQPDTWDIHEDNRTELANFRDYFHCSVGTAPSPIAEFEPSGRHRRARRRYLAPVENSVPGSVKLDFVVSERWVVTVHEGDVPALRRFREQDKADTVIGRLTGQALAASLLDWHLGEYFHEVSRIEEAVDKLDERVLRESTSQSLLGRMVALRRRVSKLRSLLVAQRQVFYGLSRPDFALVSASGATSHYEGLVSRFERAVDEVERTRDVVVGSFELFTSRTGQQTNDLVKVLTFVTAIIGFCAAIAGLMGMNFKADVFESGNAGFYAVTGGLTLLALISLAFARWRDWI